MIVTFFNHPTVRVILTIIVILVLAYILFKFRSTKNPKDDSLDIMKERLNKGEISEADYNEAKKRQGKK